MMEKPLSEIKFQTFAILLLKALIRVEIQLALQN